MHAAGAKAGDAIPEAERHVHGEARGEARPGEVRDSGARAVRLPAGTLPPPAPLPIGQAELRLLRFRHLDLAVFYHLAILLSSIAQGPDGGSWPARVLELSLRFRALGLGLM